jgi:hypothetical protein
MDAFAPEFVPKRRGSDPTQEREPLDRLNPRLTHQLHPNAAPVRFAQPQIAYPASPAGALREKIYVRLEELAAVGKNSPPTGGGAAGGDGDSEADRNADRQCCGALAVMLGFGRIVALHHRSSTL